MPQPKLMKTGSPDNFQTDPKALDCLVPYIPREIQNPHGNRSRTTTIWESACGKGNLVRAFEQKGYKVKGTDIQKDGRDFLAAPPYESYQYDYIVTNPPFSLKEEFLARCYQFGKPFALLLPITTFDSKERRKMMAANGIEIILPSGRIHFETPNREKNIKEGKKEGGAWFYSAWFTWGLNLGRQLTFCDDPAMPGI